MTATLTSAQKAEAVRDYERHTNGTGAYYQHWLGVRFTDGVKFLAETCGAWWLVDMIASHQRDIRRRHPDLWDFQCWRIAYDPGGDVDEPWIVTAWSDTPGKSDVLAVQRFPYSDFPKELLPFKSLWVESGVILLKSEH